MQLRLILFSAFCSIIEFDFELVEDVEENQIRITHPWDDTASETTSVSSSSVSDFTTTESVVRSTGEIRRRYLIKAVLDCKVNKYVPLAEAVKRGIVLYQKGAYVDTSTGAEIPVERAMAEGKIQASSVFELFYFICRASISCGTSVGRYLLDKNGIMDFSVCLNMQSFHKHS